MSTTLYGLLGWPVAHSVSPAMMNAAFRAVGQDSVYMAFPVVPDRLADAVAGLGALGARGVNVTIPHKQAVMASVQQLSDAARLAGAVNTLRFEDEGRHITGHNTDVTGWWQGIRTHAQTPWRTVTVLGAGGAARAVAAALVLHAPGVQLRIAARTLKTSAAIVRDFADVLTVSAVPWDARHEAVYEADCVVNATPIGMWPAQDDSPLADDSCFWPGQVMQDMVYRPLQTRCMVQARGKGAIVVDGLEMLIHQGAAAFTYWNDLDAPVDTMRDAAMQALAQRG